MATPPPDDDAEPVDVVASVGALDPVVGLLREFLHRSGALRAVAVVDQGDDAAIVDCSRLMPIEVTVDGRTVVLPHAIDLDAPPLPVPEVAQLPPFEVSAERGEVASPLGGIEHYARAVHGLSAALPGPRSVAMATWSTTDPGTPLSISARGGEPYVVSLGDEQFELDQ
ncbi:MAG TPA: hypothetical protein VFZ89_02425 [Solirubrobacteraceae bacterium]